jgi:hypothetical protein
MSFVELYINDLLIDLDGAKIQTDYSIAQIGAFETRNGFRGIDFDIPKTANNKTILENPDIINNTSSKPYRRLKARLLVDGIDQLIRFGDIEASSDKINVRLYGGLTTFFDVIKKKEINELAFIPTLAHNYNIANVIASRNNTSGYIYPLIDYHADSPNAIISDNNNDYDVRYMFPCLFVNQILASIIGDAGYGLQNNINLFDLQYINNPLLLPLVEPNQSNFNANSIQTTTANEFQVGIFATLVFANIFDNVTFDIQNAIKRQSETLDYDTNIFTRTVDFWEAKATGMYRLYGKIIYSNSFPNGSDVDGGLLRANNSNVLITLLQFTPIAGAVAVEYTFDITVNIQKGNKVFINLAHEEGATPYSMQILAGTTFNVEAINVQRMAYGSNIQVFELVPKIKQSDFLIQYLQMYCAIVQVDEFTKLVRINKFDDVLGNIGLAVDWSDKLDYSSVEEITYALDEYAITNRLLYADDDSVIKPIGTDGTIVIDDETLEDERDFIELDYAATEQVTRLSGLNISQIKLFTTNDDSPPKTEITEKVEPRVLLLENISGSVDYTDGSTTTNVTTNLPLTWFIRADKTYNLGFANSLIPSYYKTLEGVLFRTKIIKAQIRLNSLDIYNIDFLKPVYIDKFNSYFYISKISGYDCTNNESTEVELVKIR